VSRDFGQLSRTFEADGLGEEGRGGGGLGSEGVHGYIYGCDLRAAIQFIPYSLIV